MASLQDQPLEVKTFDGGFTDFFLQAPANYYEKGDNFVVNNDLKLEVRNGSYLFDTINLNHIVDSANPRRITNFVLFNNEEELFVHSGRDIFYRDPTWTKLTGPSGNEVLSEGGYYNYSTYIQWNGHTVITNDAGSLPSKIYRDEAGDLQVRSVGLPQVKTTEDVAAPTTLSQCIALANNLKSVMLSHFLDAQFDTAIQYPNFRLATPMVPPVSPNPLHAVRHHAAAEYLQAQTPGYLPAFSGTLPTPAPDATDSASLYTLVEALLKAQKLHVTDAATVVFTPSVDQDALFKVGGIHAFATNSGVTITGVSGPNFPVTDVDAPTTLEEARVKLNTLYKYWKWHTLAYRTHAWINVFYFSQYYMPVTDYDVLNRYPITASNIPDPGLDGQPVLTPNYGNFISYVTALKYLYNGHTSNGFYLSRDAAPPSDGVNYNTALGVGANASRTTHSRNPGTTLYENNTILKLDAFRCELPDPVTFDDACLTLYWVRAGYSPHVADAAAAITTGFSATIVSGNANITAVKDSSGSNIALPVSASYTIVFGPYLFTTPPITGPIGENFSAYATASDGTAGTATLSKTAAASGSVYGVYSTSRFHGSPGLSGFPVAQSTPVTSDEQLSSYSSIPSTTSDWFSTAVECFSAITAHTANTNNHWNVLTGLGTFLNYAPAQSFNLNLPRVGSFLYSFVRKLTYKTVDGVEFVEYSNPIQKEASEFPINYPLGYSDPENPQYTGNYIPGTTIQSSFTVQYPTVISNITPLSNDTKSNYDLTKIETQIYRTINAGTTYYLLDTLPNSTTSYEDSANDTLSDNGSDALVDKETLYTTGGVVGFDQPPRAKFVHILANTAIYGGIYDGDQFFPNRVLQSIPGTPMATNLTFFDDLEEDVNGIASTGSNILVWSKTKTYRLLGGYNELGQGNLSHEKISDNVGCVAAGSIVATDTGIYFAGNDGFYFTDGFVVTKVSAHIDKTYQKIVASDQQRSRITGCYDRLERRIYWTVQSTDSGLDCDTLFVIHADYGEKKSGVFTKWLNTENFMPSAVTYFDNKLIRGDYRGVLYEHTKLSKTDPTIPSNLADAPSSWGTTYIPWWYKSAALDYNTTFKGQWATRLHIMGKNVGNVGMQVSTIREDNNQHTRDLSQIYWLENIMWGDPNLNWGDDGIIWQYDTTLDEWRRFPTQSLRSQFRQISMRPANLVVYKYDQWPDGSFATATAGSGTATVVMSVAPTNTVAAWPTDCDGMYISFDIDDYTNQYLVSSISGDTLTVVDADATIVAATPMKWQIAGFVKENKFSMTAYDIHYSNMGQRGKAFVSGEGGGNS